MFSADVAIHFILNVFFQISPDAPFVKKRYCRVLKILERLQIMLYSRQRRIWKQIIKVTKTKSVMKRMTMIVTTLNKQKPNKMKQLLTNCCKKSAFGKGHVHMMLTIIPQVKTQGSNRICQFREGQLYRRDAFPYISRSSLKI